jgi:hypothetical protein
VSNKLVALVTVESRIPGRDDTVEGLYFSIQEWGRSTWTPLATQTTMILRSNCQIFFYYKTRRCQFIESDTLYLRFYSPPILFQLFAFSLTSLYSMTVVLLSADICCIILGKKHKLNWTE